MFQIISYNTQNVEIAEAAQWSERRGTTFGLCLLKINTFPRRSVAFYATPSPSSICDILCVFQCVVKYPVCVMQHLYYVVFISKISSLFNYPILRKQHFWHCRCRLLLNNFQAKSMYKSHEILFAVFGLYIFSSQYKHEWGTVHINTIVLRSKCMDLLPGVGMYCSNYGGALIFCLAILIPRPKSKIREWYSTQKWDMCI